MFGNIIKVLRMGDKRRDRRVPVRLPATVGAAKGRVTDISLGGCGFYPDNAGLKVGAESTISITLRDGRLVTIPVEIVSSDEENMVYSIGFGDMDHEAFEAIANIMASHLSRPDKKLPHLPMPRRIPKIGAAQGNSSLVSATSP